VPGSPRPENSSDAAHAHSTPDLLAGKLVLREVDIAGAILRYAVLPRSFEIVEGFFVDTIV
jgi:hypothetical protein